MSVINTLQCPLLPDLRKKIGGFPNAEDGFAAFPLRDKFMSATGCPHWTDCNCSPFVTLAKHTFEKLVFLTTLLLHPFIMKSKSIKQILTGKNPKPFKAFSLSAILFDEHVLALHHRMLANRLTISDNHDTFPVFFLTHQRTDTFRKASGINLLNICSIMMLFKINLSC